MLALTVLRGPLGSTPQEGGLGHSEEPCEPRHDEPLVAALHLQGVYKREKQREREWEGGRGREKREEEGSLDEESQGALGSERSRDNAPSTPPLHNHSALTLTMSMRSVRNSANPFRRRSSVCTEKVLRMDLRGNLNAFTRGTSGRSSWNSAAT